MERLRFPNRHPEGKYEDMDVAGPMSGGGDKKELQYCIVERVLRTQGGTNEDHTVYWVIPTLNGSQS